MTSSSQLSHRPGRKNQRALLWMCPLGLLAIPAIANLTSDAFNWGLGDFVVFGLMLFVLFAAIDFVTFRKLNVAMKGMLIGGAIVAFLLVWAELAVGIFP
jgi:hypothetical protein